METFSTFFHSRETRTTLAVAVFIILFIIAFWNDIAEIIVPFICADLIIAIVITNWGEWLGTLLLGLLITIAGTGISLIYKPGPNWASATFNLIYALVSFFIALYISLKLITRFVLPVQTRAERKNVLNRLWLYMRCSHGKAFFVKDGKAIISEKEKYRKGTGIALVDSASAIVLEKDMPPEQEIWESGYGKRSALLQSIYEAEKKARRTNSVIIASLLQNLRWLGVMPPRLLRRLLLKAGGLNPRKPKRPKAAARVVGPGIVLTAPNETIRATLDLRKQTRSRQRIKGVTREGIEVETTINVTFALDDGETPDKKKDRKNTDRNIEPYIFHAPSGFKAVYGTPVAKVDTTETEEEDQVREWTDLPTFVASDIFRDMISTQNFDNLFRPSSDDELPLNSFRESFGDRVKDEPMLKERGIKVLSAAFGKFTLTHDKVKTQRFETWQAPWRKKTTETLAAGDLQAARIIQRERAEAQRLMMKELANILSDKHVTKTAVVLRLFKSLESASADPSVRRLLASDTVEILSRWTGNLHSWVGVGGDGTGEKT